ncbi:TetR/AcrR family transcriptional regulator [Antrihabitans sp. YC2-6]|uniref:TetR/AcrR family transcriptional regulator n=1 Tax=Antrihabitans sp. YC2-6 TaxID=2799498 RepID=UPI0018F5C7DF|nr:TetR/AcrR family transcriptional regulator [Antrihabitans sp. YC2-6]MBJ8345503.1 TetR/AcrR family transcriptional regulator [Antrihabitans sp. YC2-6]
MPENLNDPSKADGRKQRWQDHKEARRDNLVDGTISAIRKLGPGIGMDQIAAEIGISKIVLYRYFTDKDDLTNAAMVRFVEVVLAPRIFEIMAAELDDLERVRSVISAYVDVVNTDTDIYLYLTSAESGQFAYARAERMIADAVAVILTGRIADVGMPITGAEPWSYFLVGGIQLATKRWISHKTMSSEQLVDHLVMIVWSCIAGIYGKGASVETFNARPHPLVIDAENA